MTGLYELLPRVYQRRDADAGYALRGLLAVLEEQRRIMSDAIDQLYDDWFIETCQDWLVPYLHGMARLAELERLDLVAILRGMLPRHLAAQLDRALPMHLALPHGSAPVDYTEAVPVAAARAQAFYGMVTTPMLAEGRIKLRLALLSPAGRPIAVTADLANFWRSSWSDARRDMRGRYPKHDWPEDGGHP